MGRAARIDLRPGVEELGQLYPWFDAVADAHALTKSQRFEVQLVLEEAATNSALHGFPPGADGFVSVQAEVRPASVTLVVRDDGKAFDPTKLPEQPLAATLETATVSGRGLRLLRRYCSAMRYQRQGTVNELTLTVPLKPQAGGR